MCLVQTKRLHSYSILFYSILFYSRLRPSTAGSSPPPESSIFLSFAILVHTAPCCPTMSSLQRRFDLLTDLTPSVCHCVLLIVHLLSFIRAMCPAHFHFVLVTYWTMSVTLVLCLMTVLRILSGNFRSFVHAPSNGNAHEENWRGCTVTCAQGCVCVWCLPLLEW